MKTKRSRNSLLSFASLSLAALAVAGCQSQPRDVNINLLPFSSFQPQIFDDPANIQQDEPGASFQNVQFILWKEPVPSKDTVRRAIELSKEYENVEKLAEVPKGREDELIREYGDLFAKSESLAHSIQSTGTILDKKKLELNGKLTARTAKLQALADEYAKEQPDAEAIKKLRAECDALKAGVDQAQAMVDKLQAQLEKLSKDKADLDPEIADPRNERKECEKQLAQLSLQGNDVVRRLNEIAQFPEQNPKFLIQPSSAQGPDAIPGALRIQLEGWATDGVTALDYDSEPEDGSDPTIFDVTYSPWGGVLEFNACVHYLDDEKPGIYAYHFHLARVSYEKPGVHYAGEISRNTASDAELESNASCTEIARRQADEQTRYGIAKLSDKYN